MSDARARASAVAVPGPACSIVHEPRGVYVRYVMLIYETADDFAARSNDDGNRLFGAWRAYHRQLLEAGVYVSGAPLQPPDETGTTVRVRSGRRQVEDGPYADTKEQLGGFMILELPSLDAALDWASRCPTAASGAVEIRPVSEPVRARVEDDEA
jgi:hypothetical protein